MTKLIEKSFTQNKKSARKRRTFDFFPSLNDEKTIKNEQIFQNNIISKREKGQSCTNRIDLNKQTITPINKKGGLPMI